MPTNTNTPPQTAATTAAIADTADPLFRPIRVGELDLPHRIIMAPLTRSRAAQPGDIPQDMNVTYYRQRASAALIVSEATQVSQQAKGYAFTPGIHSPEQVDGWKRVTDAVHHAGGRIFLQLWHVGRISHTDLQPDNAAPVAPSAVRAKSKTYTHDSNGMVDVSQPRALRTDEIPGVVEQFRTGARNAKQAGFDGVEIHGANGYLLDQFTRDGTNLRDDDYGGPIENRLRFPLEVTNAVLDVWEPGRVGYRVSPTGDFNDLADSDPKATFGQLAEKLGKLKLAYIHTVEAFAGGQRDDDVIKAIRQRFKDAGGSTYIANGGYTAQLARQRIDSNDADAVAFGEPFIGNPDLPERFRINAPLNDNNKDAYYGGDEKGYTDYPTLQTANHQ